MQIVRTQITEISARLILGMLAMISLSYYCRDGLITR